MLTLFEQIGVCMQMVKLIYGKAMHEAAFNATMPLYIGSGLLTYGAKEGQCSAISLC